MRLRDVTLRVGDLERSVAFYRDVIGLAVLDTLTDGTTAMGFSELPALRLVAAPGAPPRHREEAGLFHVAWLLRDRAHLGAALRRLEAYGVPLTGAADHHVSEAVYLDDPDGNGIELYADRPAAHWRQNGQLVLVNDRLDLGDLVWASHEAGLQPEASSGDARLGHVHLEAVELAATLDFARDALDLELQAAWEHARFFGWDGYHHHLAWNDWNGRRRPVDPQAGRLGLVDVGIAGWPTHRRVADPNGIAFVGRGETDATAGQLHPGDVAATGLRRKRP